MLYLFQQKGFDIENSSDGVSKLNRMFNKMSDHAIPQYY